MNVSKVLLRDNLSLRSFERIITLGETVKMDFQIFNINKNLIFLDFQLLFHFKMPPKKQAYYVVKRGHKTGIFETWAQCQEQVATFDKPWYKKFEVIIF